MSIAVSARVRPSRALRLVTGGAGLVQLGAACATGLTLSDPAARYLAAPLATAALLVAGTLLVATAARRPKTHQIDISGTGELRVTVQQELHVPASCDAGAAELLPGSAVWPLLMLLRYRVAAADGRRRTGVLHVWRDGVDAAAWRALAVALTVAGRHAKGRRENDKNTMN